MYLLIHLLEQTREAVIYVYFFPIRSFPRIGTNVKFFNLHSLITSSVNTSFNRRGKNSFESNNSTSMVLPYSPITAFNENILCFSPGVGPLAFVFVLGTMLLS